MPSLNDFQPFRSDQKRVPVVIVVFASLSTVALTFVCLRAVWHVTSPLFTRNSRHTQSKAYAFFNTQLGHYSACLLASNLCTSIAGTIAGNWVARGGVQPGSLCTAQAFLIQVGNWATAYFTGAIALHTCRSLVFHSAQKSRVAYAVMVVGWLSAIAVGVAPLKMASSWKGSTYGFDGFSCGIKRVYPVPEFVFHLLPIFVAAIVTVAIYSLIYLVLRGTLDIMGGFKLNLDPHQRWGRHDAFEEYHRFIRAVAKSMLWFPVAYVFLLLPYSVTKLLDLSGYSVAFGTNVFAETCAVMLGLVNVCILHNTFRVLEPVFEARSSSGFRDADMESSESPVEKTSFFDQPPVAPSRSWSVRKPVPSYRPNSRTSQKSVSDTGSDFSLRFVIPWNDKSGGRSSSPFSLGRLNAASIGQPIIPASELNSAIVFEPDTILQKRDVGVPDDRLPYGHSRSSTSESRESLWSLPAPPRRTRSPVARRPTIETIASASPSKDQWSNADISEAFSAHSRGVSGSSISSFGVKLRPALQKDQLNAPGRHARQRSRSPLPPQKPPISSSLPSPSLSPPELGPSSSLTIPSRLRLLPQVPSDVVRNDFGSAPVSVAFDVIDGFPSSRFRTPTEIVTPGELTSLAWATLVTDAATTNGTSSVQRHTPSASAKSTRNGVVDPADHRQDGLVSSVASRGLDVQLQQGPSKKPALSGGPSTSS